MASLSLLSGRRGTAKHVESGETSTRRACSSTSDDSSAIGRSREWRCPFEERPDAPSGAPERAVLSGNTSAIGPSTTALRHTRESRRRRPVERTRAGIAQKAIMLPRGQAGLRNVDLGHMSRWAPSPSDPHRLTLSYVDFPGPRRHLRTSLARRSASPSMTVRQGPSLTADSIGKSSRSTTRVSAESRTSPASAVFRQSSTASCSRP